MRFARVMFTVAGIWGLLVLTPLYFLIDRVGREYPPPVTHPDFYYGFIGVALAWQLAFLVIGRDPVRFRPLMFPAICEKAFHVVTMAVLFAQGSIQTGQFAVALPDFVLGCLFIASVVLTRAESTP
jgi:hypothetical protein